MSREGPQKVWARSVQPFWRLLDTKGQTSKVYIYIDKCGEYIFWSGHGSWIHIKENQIQNRFIIQTTFRFGVKYGFNKNIYRIGQSLRSGPEFCPRVNATSHGSPEILVSAGLPKSVRVKVFFSGLPLFLFCFMIRYFNRLELLAPSFWVGSTAV